jgi:hypothetical protein
MPAVNEELRLKHVQALPVLKCGVGLLELEVTHLAIAFFQGDLRRGLPERPPRARITEAQCDGSSGSKMADAAREATASIRPR